MACARKFHTSTLLIDGSVLVAGGSDRAGDLKSAERYAPIADQWHAAASMSTPRCHHNATRLLSGCVLVTGGFSGAALRSAELFDPIQNQWCATPLMQHAQGHGLHTATLLQDGRVLVASSSGAELFDPDRNTWHATAFFGSDYQTATLMQDGHVLLAGGSCPWDVMGTSAMVTRYIPATERWQPARHLPQSRVRHNATLLKNGHLLIAAGDDGRCQYVTHSLCYDPVLDLWSFAGALTTAREHCTNTCLLDGSVMLVGGDGAEGILASAERFDSDRNRWQPTAAMFEARYLHSATLLEDGRLLVAGGVGQSAALASVEIFSAG